jgi:hypothetical protein
MVYCNDCGTPTDGMFWEINGIIYCEDCGDKKRNKKR